MNKFADLHMHTYFSDGTSSPEEVVEESLKARLSCIAITDHDTVEGVAATMAAARDKELEVISGIELSTEYEGKDIHILGYLIDHRSPVLLEKIRHIQQARIMRIQQMIDKLKEHGIDDIGLEEVCALTESNSVGRPHLASVLVKKKWVTNIKSAFDKYLGEGCPAYISKYKMTPVEGIDLIRGCGGVSVMAHPMSTNKDEVIPQLVNWGLQGLEVFYPNYSNTTIEYYKNLAKKHGLLMTGGSDAHGSNKDNTYIGKAQVPYEYVEQLKERAAANKR